jgi:hypothetical protein
VKRSRRAPKAKDAAELVRRLHLRDTLLDAAAQLDRLPRLGREVFGSPESARTVFQFLARDLELSVDDGTTGTTLQDGTSITWTGPRVRIVKALVRELRARARGIRHARARR